MVLSLGASIAEAFVFTELREKRCKLQTLYSKK